MPRGVLVPFDRSPLSERALEYALERFPDASITTIYVINPVDAVYDVEIGGLPVAKGWQEDARTRAEAVHAAASEIAATHERELETATVVGRPAREILDYVDEHDLEYVVIGSHSRSEEDRTILGRVAETVTRRARIPVTVVR